MLFNHSSYYYYCSPTISFPTVLPVSVLFALSQLQSVVKSEPWGGETQLVCPASSNQEWLAREEQTCKTAATLSPCTLAVHPLCGRWDTGKVLLQALTKDTDVHHIKLRKMGKARGNFHFRRLYSFSSCWFQSIHLRCSYRSPWIELYALLPGPTLICVCQKLVCGLCSPPFLTLAMCVPSFKLCFLEELQRIQSSPSNQGQVSSRVRTFILKAIRAP